MYRQVKTTPRKRPRQGRSKATVDAILAATARVLVKRGFDGLTTNAVAEAAGVSIGSLYQYFPNKEALVAALIESHMNEKNARILDRLASVATLPMAQAVRAMIELTIENYGSEPELKRVILEQIPRVGRLARIMELYLGTQHLVKQLLTARRDELAIDDPDTASYILVAAIEAIAHRAVFLHPERLRDPRLVDEATAMVTRYLGVSEGS
ncbi:MAG TPA: TetR/AcrR family transcriptional regulator [Kofleriaceae bacterium]|nr:TetR/AcrR family transcriptional regulator [Kofleriaceae bacterium]